MASSLSSLQRIITRRLVKTTPCYYTMRTPSVTAPLMRRLYSTGAEKGSTVDGKPLTEASVNKCVREMEYAVRGAVPLEALRITSLLNKVSNTALMI